MLPVCNGPPRYVAFYERRCGGLRSRPKRERSRFRASERHLRLDISAPREPPPGPGNDPAAMDRHRKCGRRRWLDHVSRSLAAGAQDVHHAVHDGPHVEPAAYRRRVSREGSTAGHMPIRHQSGCSDISSDRCRTSPGSCPSTMLAPPRIKMGSIESK
jgi:hypothetical protein